MAKGYDKPSIDLMMATRAVVARDIALGLVDPDKMRFTVAALAAEAKKLTAPVDKGGKGMNQRAAAKALGVDKRTIGRDVGQNALESGAKRPTKTAPAAPAKPVDPAEIAELRPPEVGPVSKEALWLWGRLRDFEKEDISSPVLLKRSPGDVRPKPPVE
jgi:hypothetical protein